MVVPIWYPLTATSTLPLPVIHSLRSDIDWFIKSKTAQELGRRCESLVKLAESELEDRKASVPLNVRVLRLSSV